ncbi:hypothetical protein R3P38DRAFT_1402892 [Favolaschia claudopus]|uniref:Uncharacterized protein n=1 Tax=Favolaschia claudopus TaxID=2862362 RepID=A0AAW0ASI0_9AGAR
MPCQSHISTTASTLSSAHHSILLSCMASLARQSSPSSVHSWWSDSNPNLQSPATINLHTVAKPLEKYFYHRQAVNMMKKKRQQPLDGELLEIYASYLPWKFVSMATKTMILDELGSRVSRNPSEAQTVFESPLFFRLHQLKETLRSPDQTQNTSSLQAAADALLQSIYINRAVTLVRPSRGQPVSPDLSEAFASLNLPWNFNTLGMILDCIEQQILEIQDKSDLQQPSVLYPLAMKPFPMEPFETMNPLAKPSRVSISSWWSDSTLAPSVHNSATINLHAAAKPLLKFLYHRQVISMIRKHRGQALSVEALEIYASYLPWSFVSKSTKAILLSDLDCRALQSQSEALTMVDSPMFQYLTEMQLEESDSQLKIPDLGAEKELLQPAAKRLMKSLFNTLVCAFLEENSSRPLSAEMLHKYTSYLQESRVPRSTKFTILNDLYHRAKQGGDAQAIIDSPVVLHLKQMHQPLDGQEGTVALQTIIRFLMQELYHYQQASNLSTMVREVLEGWTESESSNSDANLKQLFHAMLGIRLAA